MGEQFRRERRPTVLVADIALGLRDVAIHDIPLRPLEFEERQEGFADRLDLVHLQRQLDERIEVANPDFAVSAAGIESGLQQVPGLLQNQ